MESNELWTRRLCHVKGCDQFASDISWFPAFQCALAFCKRHAATPENERVDWVIELGRAKQEDAAARNQITALMEKKHGIR